MNLEEILKVNSLNAEQVLCGYGFQNRPTKIVDNSVYNLARKGARPAQYIRFCSIAQKTRARKCVLK